MNNQDSPSVFSHPGWRVAYNIVTCFLLAITLSPGTSLFVGFFMLSCGLLFDYSRFNASTPFRKVTKKVGCWLTVITILINVSAAFGAFTVSSDLKQVKATVVFLEGYTLPTQTYWLIFVVLLLGWTVLDWAAEARQNKLFIERQSQVQNQAQSQIFIGNPSLNEIKSGGK